jgi:hypothetical protein
VITAMSPSARADDARHGAANVAVIVGPDAPPLDRLAARELCKYLEVLFAVRAEPSTSLTPAAGNVILIGNPSTNSLIDRSQFPEVTDQGVVVKSTKLADRPALIVGGGSPRATLWAAYALAERWGVRFLLHRDVLPAKTTFHMPGAALDVKEEPLLRIRQWRVLNEHAMGPISWGIADYRPLLDQLAKLRFNRVLLYTLARPAVPAARIQGHSPDVRHALFREPLSDHRRHDRALALRAARRNTGTPTSRCRAAIRMR